MCKELPKDIEDMYEIIGSNLSEKYGQIFISVISGHLNGEEFVEVNFQPKPSIANYHQPQMISDDELEHEKPDFGAEFDDLDDLILQEQEDEHIEVPKPRYNPLVSPKTPSSNDPPPYFSKKMRLSNSSSSSSSISEDIFPEENDNMEEGFFNLDDFEIAPRKRTHGRISDRFDTDWD